MLETPLQAAERGVQTRWEQQPPLKKQQSKPLSDCQLIRRDH